MNESLGGLSLLGLLGDDLRRRMYTFIRRAGRGVTRDEVAREHGISRTLAAFHLDKLLEGGLLKATYARPAGRSGPGAGRTSKYYEPSDVEISVSVPERRYELAGRLMAEAIRSQGPGESTGSAADRAAGEEGLRIGETARARRGLRRPGRQATLALAEEVLAEYGFEPYRTEAGELALRNCPFHLLSKAAPDVVCSMNRSLIQGVLHGLGSQSVEAVLEPNADECCVRLRAAARSRGRREETSSEPGE
ncbi:MAG TPA: helix-turn-helix domain-containing protein [Actinomycetota bacterium]|jgi:predicted ArsR family transcriptional regulator